MQQVQRHNGKLSFQMFFHDKVLSAGVLDDLDAYKPRVSVACNTVLPLRSTGDSLFDLASSSVALCPGRSAVKGMCSLAAAGRVFVSFHD